jgi:gas vesicle protein
MATQSPSSGSATDTAKEQVQEKTQDAQEKVKEGAQQAQARMRDQVDQRSTQAGEQVSATADALRTTSRQLRDQGQDGPAQVAEKVAHHAERVGGYLSESSADRILGDLEDFGRRQPLAVIGIGLAAGFVASRFLKASSRERYQARPPRPAGTAVPAAPAMPDATAPAIPASKPRPAITGNGA